MVILTQPTENVMKTATELLRQMVTTIEAMREPNSETEFGWFSGLMSTDSQDVKIDWPNLAILADEAKLTLNSLAAQKPQPYIDLLDAALQWMQTMEDDGPADLMDDIEAALANPPAAPKAPQIEIDMSNDTVSAVRLNGNSITAEIRDYDIGPGNDDDPDIEEDDDGGRFIRRYT